MLSLISTASISSGQTPRRTGGSGLGPLVQLDVGGVDALLIEVAHDAVEVSVECAPLFLRRDAVDRRVEEDEAREFRRLCKLLDLEPGEVWEGLEMTAE